MDGLAVSPSGQVYLTGYTKAPDFPLTQNALSTLISQNAKTFVSVVDPAFTTLVYSTVLPDPVPTRVQRSNAMRWATRG